MLDRQLTHMVRIVDDLLDVSRITQGKVELRREVVDLKNVVSAAVDLCQPIVDAAGQDITVSLPDEPVKLDADPVRLAQVLVNLVNNAVKFTPSRGHIWLLAETTGEHPEAPDRCASGSATAASASLLTCCREFSTCSCRAIGRWSARAAGWASA